MTHIAPVQSTAHVQNLSTLYGCMSEQQHELHDLTSEIVRLPGSLDSLNDSQSTDAAYGVNWALNLLGQCYTCFAGAGKLYTACDSCSMLSDFVGFCLLRWSRHHKP